MRSNQYYNPEPAKHPPPTDIDPGVRGELEVYIRRKYERRDFVRKDPVRSARSSQVQTNNYPTAKQSHPSRPPVVQHMLGVTQSVPLPSPTASAATATTHVNMSTGAFNTNGNSTPAVSNAQYGIYAPLSRASPSPPTQSYSGSSVSPSVYSDLLELQDGPPIVHANYALPSAAPFQPAPMAYAPSYTPMTSYMAPVPTGMHYAAGMYTSNPMMASQGMAPYPTWLYPTQ
ncbi:hypothetical protein CBS9595_000893 [Malassezia furfur]|nr:hypothetical protein CBS9595_000893 [Malassezia furfur]